MFLFDKFIYSSSVVYNTKTYLYQYNDDIFRIVKCNSVRGKGFELMKNSNSVNKAESERCSLSRTRRNIREIALCNNFTYFVTLTINSERCDRYALDNCQEKLRTILKKIKRKNKDFIYLFITEKHKDGAFHFHGLCNDTLDFYINDNSYLSSRDFDGLGFNSFSKIESLEKVSNYILKYITKDCVKNSAGTVYISSRGLKKATVTELSNDLDINFDYTNDYCSIKDFNVNNLSRDELLNIMSSMKKNS